MERGKPSPSLEMTVIWTHKPFKISSSFLESYIPMFYPKIASILCCIDKETQGGEVERAMSLFVHFDYFLAKTTFML